LEPLRRVNARTHVPVRAVVLQGVAATVIALTGEYGRILDTVVSADWIFFGLSAACVFGLRRADAVAARPAVAGIPLIPGRRWRSSRPSAWIVFQSLAHDPKEWRHRPGAPARLLPPTCSGAGSPRPAEAHKAREAASR
jgi:APA family basic amino acid/polyamine antiporter